MAAFILVMSNIIIMIVGYLIINYLLKKRYINEEILNQIKKDISNMIRQMNEITERNVELIQTSRRDLNGLVNEKETQVTEMLLSIEKKIRIIDDRMKQLKTLSPEQMTMMRAPAVNVVTETSENTSAAKTYNYIDILNKSNAAATAKKQAEEEEKKKQKELEDKLAAMDISDQVGYLSDLGYSHTEIKKKLGISDGEIELSLSLYKTRRQ